MRRHSTKSKAHFSNSTTEDVTRWTVFTPEDTSAIEIDASTAVAKVNRRGRHIILARYLTEVVPIELIAPLNDVPVQNIHSSGEVHTSPESTIKSIDKEILKLLSTLRLPVSPAADDVTFLRRVTLDLTGRIPISDTVTAFLADSNAKKRETLVDTLLQSDELMSTGHYSWRSCYGLVHVIETHKVRLSTTNGFPNRLAEVLDMTRWHTRLS